MPLPKPKTGESKDDFISRCMGDETMLGEYPDQEQRAGICYSQWEGKDQQTAKLVCAGDLAGGAPTWWLLWPKGWVQLEGADPILIDDQAMAEVIANFERRGNDLVIDYEHSSIFAEKAPAAGWIKGLAAQPDGLWVRSEWTDQALKLIANKEYRYFSPAFDVRIADRRPVQINSVALTNTPQTNQLKPLVSKANTNSREAAKEREDEAMSKELLTKLGKLLEVEGEPTEETVTKAIQAKMTALAQGPPAAEAKVPAEVFGALELKEDASTSEVVATIRALKQGAGEHAKLAEKVTALEAESAERVKTELVTKAVREGKITPAQREWAEEYARRDPKGFEVYISKAVVVVPVDQRITGDEKPKPETGLTETQQQINKMTGISKETWEKFGPKAA